MHNDVPIWSQYDCVVGAICSPLRRVRAASSFRGDSNA